MFYFINSIEICFNMLYILFVKDEMILTAAGSSSSDDEREKLKI